MISTKKSNRETISVLLPLFLAPFLIYWPIVAFPYLLMDDNWLTRGWTEIGYPSRGFISFVQGRPTFMFLAWGSSFLIREFSELGIQLFRSIGLLILGICVAFVYFYSRYLPLSRPFRVLAAILWITFPAMQVYVANGTWVLVGIAAALGATLIILRPLNYFTVGAAIFLIWIAASTYQPTAFLVPALYLLTLPVEWSKEKATEFLKRSLVVGFSFITYFIGWKLVYAIMYPGSGEARYNPNATISFREFPSRLRIHVQSRFMFVLNIWDIPNGFPSIRSYVHGALGIAVIAALHGSITRYRNSLRIAGSRLIWIAIWPIAFVVADFAVIPSRTLVMSYTTMLGGSLVVSLAICCILSYAVNAFKTLRSFAFLIVATTIVLGSIMASVSISRHFVIPTWLDAKLIRLYAKERMAQPSAGERVLFCYIGLTHVYSPSSPDPAYGAIEFTWSNMGPFYAYWHTRTLLDMMGTRSDNITVVIKNPMTGKIDDIAPLGASGADQCSHWADFSAQSKHDLFR